MANGVALGLSDHRTDRGITEWLAQLGVTDAPLPRSGVRTALQFFQLQMPTLPADMALNFLRAMDLSRAVKSVTLSRADTLIAFRVQGESPFKLFYTRGGASPYSSGINPANRGVVRFRVKSPCLALESYTSGAIDIWTTPAPGQRLSIAPRANTTGVMAAGGGIQLIVPNAAGVLEVVR
jgi:hypothetical protein